MRYCDGKTSQCNLRHKPVTVEGRKDMFILFTFTLTTYRPGMSVVITSLEITLDRYWGIFNRVNVMPFSLVNSDVIRYSIFDGFGLPILHMA